MLQRNTRCYTTRAIHTVLSALALSGASARTTAQASALEEIIVTASKRTESLQDVPISVNAFSDQVIQDAGIHNASDLAILTPSLTITTNISPFTAAFRIRGIGTSQSDIALEPSVGLFIDDVYLNRSGLGMSDLNDIERIEVLQGPQGTLYGKNTNAGAVSIFTKKPNLESFEGYVETSVGDYDLRKLTASASGPLSDTIAYRITGNVHKVDGYIENSAGEDLNGADDWHVIAKLLYVPTDSLTFLLNGSHVNRDTNCCGADTVQSDSVNAELAARGLPIDKNNPFDYKVATNLDGKFKSETDALSLVIDYEHEWGDFKSITAWGQSEGSASRDVDVSQLDVIYQSNGVSSGHSFSQELRYTSETDSPLYYQLGVFYYQSTTNGGNNQPWTFLGEDIITVGSQQDAIAALIPGGLPLSLVAQPGDSIRAKVKLDTENVAAFGQATWEINDRWRTTGGLRWTYEEKDADLLVAIDSTAISAGLTGLSLLTSATTPIDDVFNRDTSDINWLLTTSYDLFDDVMIFCRVATGSKSGGFNTVNGTSAEREFDDETTISYEAGVKSTLLDARLRVNASAFYTEIEDYQIQQQLDTGIGTRVANRGEVETAGIDINLEALPLPYLTLTAGLLYMDKAEIVSGPEKGNALPFTAEYSANLSATLVLPLADGGIYIRADYSYMDDHLTNGAAVTDDNDIQDRSLLNMKAGWRNDHWNASIWAKNLNDEAYAGLTAETLPLTGMDAYFLTPPRTFGATLRYDF
jgi:iron complex outermembrane receptor protein